MSADRLVLVRSAATPATRRAAFSAGVPGAATRLVSSAVAARMARV